MSSTRNVTLTLDETVLRGAKVLAAENGMSLSALLRAELERLVAERDGYARAREVALRRLAAPRRLGGGRLPRREDLHDRAKLR
jgi:hypothetical protein